MRKPFYLSIVIMITLSTITFASSINKITLSELRSKATYIVTGEVTYVAKRGNQDTIYILVDSYLKGKSPQAYFKFILISRGGLKDFDPALKKGDTGVFFLKKTGKKWETKKAYWGSVATFQENNFHISKKKKNTEKKLSELGPLSDLQKAAFRGNVNLIRQILKKLDKKGKVEALTKGSNSLYGYTSPLRLAIGNGQTKAVNELIVLGANVNEGSFYGKTLLANAAQAGHVDIIKLLLKAGAKVDMAYDSYTALMNAAIGGQPRASAH